jgi:toxin CcdB
MPQFDVYRNPGRNKVAVPFVVDVQSGRYAALPMRVAVPLMAVRNPATGTVRELTPEFRIAGQPVFLNPLDMQSVPRSALGAKVTSLADDESAGRIINAIDLVISRVYG